MIIYILIFLVLAILTLLVHIFGSNSQIGTFRFLVMFSITTIFSGFVGSIALGLADSLGALFAKSDTPTYRKITQIRLWGGVLLSATMQSIFIIFFIALIVSFVKYAISQPNTCSWILWIAGFVIAISPAAYAAGRYKLEKLMDMIKRDCTGGLLGDWTGGLLGFLCIICIFISPVLYLLFVCSPKVTSYFSLLSFVY